MGSVLIVSDSDKLIEMLTEMCKSRGLNNICASPNAEHAIRAVKDSSFDIVIIDQPVSGENRCKLALFIAENYLSGVLLLVSGDKADEVTALVEESGVFVLQKPVDRAFFLQSVGLIITFCQRLRGLHSKAVKLESKIEETQLVDRAKCVLIQYLSMTEPQAHRYIEKQSMDMRRPKREIAKSIINTYEY